MDVGVIGVLWGLVSLVFAADAPTRIAFGSCADQTAKQPIWDAVIAAEPQLFVFLGDNVYGDTVDMAELQAAYDALGAQPGYRRLREKTPVVAIWDDHDYGANDAGSEYPKKAESKAIFLDFFGEPADSERRRRPGNHTHYTYGEPGRRIQVILPDQRWFRTPVNHRDRTVAQKARHQGGYLPTPTGTMIGEAQWDWLEGVLAEPADLRIIGSSTQMLAEGTGWEAWANFPHERARLLDALKKAGSTVIVSGDMHWAELTQVRHDGTTLTELTTSGLTKTWHGIGPNDHRVGEPFGKANFGLLVVDWEARTVQMEVRDVNGAQQITTSVPF